MRVAIVGLGNQGQKWRRIAGTDVVAIAEPNRDTPGAFNYAYVTDIPLNAYDVAIVCTPNHTKSDIVQYLIHNNKHVLVEKPLAITAAGTQALLKETAGKRLVLQTSYNLRFEPHVQRVQELLQEGTLGNIYHCRMLYGYGTAQDVKGTWRDHGLGVVPEVASHLFDLAVLWFGEDVLKAPANVAVSHFEVNSFDRTRISFEPPSFLLDMEASWLCWENRFRVDIYAEHGSVHIDGLLKWGQSRFSLHTRKLPSGAPLKHTSIWTGTDDSLSAQYQEFKSAVGLAALGKPVLEDLNRDIAISRLLADIQQQVDHG